MTRAHKIYEARVDQLMLNFLAQAGGKPYTEVALQRYPNESNASWSGSSGISGRMSRCSCINDAGRISQKINQFLFSRKISRYGVNEDWSNNVNSKGTSINDFWESVSDNLTAGQWVWLKADRMSYDGERSLAERPDYDQVRWTAYPSTSVPDWSFAEDGSLKWIIVEEDEYINNDPLAEATTRTVRYLWQVQDSIVTWQKYIGVKGKPVLLNEGTVSGKKIPFVLVGEPSDGVWWYDTVESVVSGILNLESSNTENTVRTVFPSLVMSKAAFENLEVKLMERLGSSDGKQIVELAREVVRSIDVPLIESAEERNITRYLMPDPAALGFIPGEIKRKRAELFESVGLNLFNAERKTVESAEARKFSFLDVNATLAHRANVLQTAERKLINVSAELDSQFDVYEVVWPSDYSVLDLETEARVMAIIDKLSLTDEQRTLYNSIVSSNLTKATE